MKETTLCYIEKDDKYLMLHRTKKENDQSKDKWLGVGGKLEKGETSDQCLIREVMEETGLALQDYQYRAKIYFYSDIYEDEIMHLYTSSHFSGDIISCDEGELAWIDKSEILNLKLWEGDRLFLEKLLKDDMKPFVLSLYYEGDKLIEAKEEAN